MSLALKTKPRGRRATRAGKGDMRFVPHASLYRPDAEKRFLGTEIKELVAEQGRLKNGTENTLFQALHTASYLAHRESKIHSGRKTRRYHRLAGLRQQVRQRLVDANLGLVYDLVRRSRFTNVENDDLVSVGLFALLQAVDAFNPWRGFRFSTYACNAIIRAFIRLSMTETRRRQHAPASFDPLLEKSDHPQTMHNGAADLYTERLANILDGPSLEMNETERFVLSRRFPTDPTRKRQTLEQIGLAIHVSKERVRQIQNGALSKLREAIDADPVLK